jgi:hypothetical protein
MRADSKHTESEDIMRNLLSYVAAAAMGLGGVPAGAEETTCRGRLRSVSVDNLRVPEGVRCRLHGTRVAGTVSVERDATLKTARIDVVGNVQGAGARHVRIAQSAVGGSVQLEQGGSARVSGSHIYGNLQCKENSPRPTGGSNVVGGNKEDQCRSL